MYTLPFVDTLASEFIADLRTNYRELVRDHWAVRSPRGVELLSYAACTGALQDERLLSATGRLMDHLDSDVIETMRGTGRTLLLSEGADHRELRGVVQPWFTPRRIEGLRETTARYVDRLLDDVEPNGTCEFVEAVARAVPGVVFCWMVGAPDSDGLWLARTTEKLLRVFARNPDDGPEILAASTELRDYIGQLLEAKRAEPGEDVASMLLAAEADGRLRTHDVESLLFEMLAASTENTMYSGAIQLWLLASHPSQWALVADDPTLVDRAVEECARYEPRVGGTPVYNPEAIGFNGLDLPPDSIVWAVFFAAHQDASVYESPEVFDVRRSGGKSQLSFGVGRHYCLGANLARMELRVLLDRVVARWDVPTVLEGAAVEHLSSTTVRRLPVSFTLRRDRRSE